MLNVINYKDLSLEERKRIAERLINNGKFGKMHLHDIESMLRINTIDNDYPDCLIEGISMSQLYENESLEEYEKRRQKTEKRILKVL